MGCFDLPPRSRNDYTWDLLALLGFDCFLSQPFLLMLTFQERSNLRSDVGREWEREIGRRLCSRRRHKNISLWTLIPFYFLSHEKYFFFFPIHFLSLIFLGFFFTRKRGTKSFFHLLSCTTFCHHSELNCLRNAEIFSRNLHKIYSWSFRNVLQMFNFVLFLAICFSLQSQNKTNLKCNKITNIRSCLFLFLGFIACFQ